ncbi:MAG TPA: glycosyltransferase family protein [Nitrososphaeraceae archaeon]|nr:glycosyltransferase family protein [Nitrososphaeraceae archaeon]
MAKAYLAPYGVGLGHASRLISISEQLKKDNTTIKFSSFGEAVSYINNHGYECVSVPPIEFAWNNGGFSVKNSIANIPLWFTNFARQIAHETRNISTFEPNVVVSDSRLSPIVSSRILGIPSVVILNQIKLLLSPRIREFRAARVFEKLNGEFFGNIWSIAEKLLIPDLPPPYTIAEHNIWNLESVKKKMHYIGFTTSKWHGDHKATNNVIHSLNLDRTKPIIFMHISGPRETRLGLISNIMGASKFFRKDIQYIISEGKPNGSIIPKKLSSTGWYYEWCPVRDEIFALSDLVVIRAGHEAISHAIDHGKPVISIPIQNHGEQLGNSEKVDRMKIGIKLDPSNTKPPEIANTIHRILDDKSYLENVQRIKKITDRHDGINNALEIIRSFI